MCKPVSSHTRLTILAAIILAALALGYAWGYEDGAQEGYAAGMYEALGFDTYEARGDRS